MYPVTVNKDKIKVSFLDRIDDLFEFVLFFVRSLKSSKSLSCFLDKNLHF